MIADVFKGQWTDKVKSLIEKHPGKVVPVPHNMTNYFQPLDLTVDQSCESFLRDKVQIWYAEQVQAQIFKGIAPESVSVDLKISILRQNGKMGHSVLRSYSHRQGCRRNWMTQNWDNQSD